MRQRAWMVGLVIGAACGGDGSMPDASTPHVDATRDATHVDGAPADAFDPALTLDDASDGTSLGDLDFPSTAVGEHVSVALIAKDSGVSPTGPLTITFLEPTTGATDYEVDPAGTTCDATAGIAAGSSCTLSIVFAPTATGERVGELGVGLTVPGDGSELELHGFGE